MAYLGKWKLVGAVAAGMVWVLLGDLSARGQAENAPAASEAESGPTVGDSRVGYIDPAIVGNQLRLRFDDSLVDRHPSQAEFLYARTGPGGPGLPRPEAKVDFQDLSAYLEIAAAERLSGFVEVPVRFLEPEVNARAAGLADMNAGGKYALIDTRDLVATFQFRIYIPTGDAHRGLGTHHGSLEPAFLFYRPLSERLTLEGEFRDWIPVGGTDFAGNVLRYGTGVDYNLFETSHYKFIPVLEFVGWTVLGGKEGTLGPAGQPFIEDVAGNTIVNAKLGIRVQTADMGEFYAGYGRALTHDKWYANTFRLEYRFAF